jgi:hypothetical protein
MAETPEQRRILDDLLASGGGHRTSDRDQLVCLTCGGPPHLHRAGCTALSTPVQCDEIPNRDAQIAQWRYWTGGRRQLVMHRGSFADRRPGTDEKHDMGDTSCRGCWCGPLLIGPEC